MPSEIIFPSKARRNKDLLGEGNGNPLQYSCLENPMDLGAWWATIHGVAKSRTQLNDFCVCGGKQNFREFVASKPSLQEMSKKKFFKKKGINIGQKLRSI